VEEEDQSGTLISEAERHIEETEAVSVSSRS